MYICMLYVEVCMSSFQTRRLEHFRRYIMVREIRSLRVRDKAAVNAAVFGVEAP